MNGEARVPRSAYDNWKMEAEYGAAFRREIVRPYGEGVEEAGEEDGEEVGEEGEHYTHNNQDE